MNLITFTYADGPLRGLTVHNVNLPTTDEPTLHKFDRTPKDEPAGMTARGMYALVPDAQGKITAVHFPGEEDKEFSDPETDAS